MELPKNLHIDIIGNTVMIQNKAFNFSWTQADAVVKDEFKGKYRYFGGLQSGFDSESLEYKELENKLAELAETILTTLNRII